MDIEDWEIENNTIKGVRVFFKSIKIFFCPSSPNWKGWLRPRIVTLRSARKEIVELQFCIAYTNLINHHIYSSITQKFSTKPTKKFGANELVTHR